MSRTQNALAAAAVLCCWITGCQGAASSPAGAPGDRPPPPSILAQPPPAVRLRAPGQAILADQAVGAPRRSGRDHLSAAQAASEQPDQAAALAEFDGWSWVDGASRTWTGADETLVVTARTDGAARAFGFWAGAAALAPLGAGSCSAAAGSGLDDCLLAADGSRAVVVGRLDTAVFRISCPAADADRLTIAQVAALHG